MTLVQAGDIIFSGVNNAIRAVSMAGGPALDADWPDPKDARNWGREGWRLDVEYQDLPRPLAYAEWVPQVRQELTYRNSPFSMTGEPNQGFLYSLPNSVGELLLMLANEAGIDVALEVSQHTAFQDQPTQKDALVKARIGQGQFRQSLLDVWEGRCPLPGLDRRELLRASHIKPWASCNNVERLDSANGLLLAVTYDAAFDACLITFDQDGSLVLARDFSPTVARAAGINASAKLPVLLPRTHEYLAAHRDLVDARLRRNQAILGLGAIHRPG